jgi:hypothetical protein
LDVSDIHYIWNGLYYFNLNKINDTNLMNWHCTLTTDTGGMMYKWLKNRICEIDEYRGVKIIKCLKSLEWTIEDTPSSLLKNARLTEFLEKDPRNNNNHFYCEIYDNKFLHYRGGGNWEKRNFKDHVELSYKLKSALLQ